MKGDEIVAREIRRNRKEALEALYDRYAPALLSICMRYCGNLQDAEDVLHDGFIKIIKSIGTFKPTSSGTFEGWMKRIMINTALNFLRDRNRENRFLAFETIQERIAGEPDEENPLDDVQDQVSKEMMMKMICELPPGYRTVFNLYVFEEFTHKEIAAELQLSENTSKSQLSKARTFLRKKIYEVMSKQKVL